MPATEILTLISSSGPWGLLALTIWRLFQREKRLDQVNDAALKLATETAASNARLATLIEGQSRSRP